MFTNTFMGVASHRSFPGGIVATCYHVSLVESVMGGGPRDAKSQWAQGLWHVRVVWVACIPSHQRTRGIQSFPQRGGRGSFFFLWRGHLKTHKPEMPKRMFRCYLLYAYLCIYIYSICVYTCKKNSCLFMKWIRILRKADNNPSKSKCWIKV